MSSQSHIESVAKFGGDDEQRQRKRGRSGAAIGFAQQLREYGGLTVRQFRAECHRPKNSASAASNERIFSELRVETRIATGIEVDGAPGADS